MAKDLVRAFLARTSGELMYYLPERFLELVLGDEIEARGRHNIMSHPMWTHCAVCTLCEHVYDQHRRLTSADPGTVAACRCCALYRGPIPVVVRERTAA